MKLPQMIRNLWIYRKVIAFVIVLGVVMAFVLGNKEEVEVAFPLVGTFSSSAGILMLVSALLGAGATWLVMTFRHTLEQARELKGLQAETAAQRSQAEQQAAGPTEASETGFSGSEKEA